MGVAGLVNAEPMTSEVDDLQRELDAERTARRQAEEALRALSIGGELIARHSGSKRDLQELVDHIRETTKADVVILYPYVEVTKLFQFPSYVSGKLIDQQGPEQKFSRLDDIASLTIRRGSSLFASNSDALYLGSGQTEQKETFGQREKIMSTSAIRLLVGDELVGVLSVNFRAPQLFDSPQKNLIRGLAHHAATAIQNVRNYARAEAELNRFSQLYKTAWELAQITDLSALDKAYESVLWSADAGQQSQAFVCRFDEEAQKLVMAHSLRLNAEIKVGSIGLDDEGVNARVARERRLIVVHDTHIVPEGTLSNRLSDSHAKSLVVIPLEFGDRYYGNLNLSHEKANYFRDMDVELINGLAKQLAITIYRLETAEARQEAEQRATEAEVMSSLGQSTIELAHRLGNALGLVKSYVRSVRETLVSNGVEITLVDESLNRIVSDVTDVLSLSKGLKQELGDLRHGTEPQYKDAISAKDLLEEIARSYPNLPAGVEVSIEIASDVEPVYAVLSHVINALRNLFFNAVEALPEGGRITLAAFNAGEYVKFEVKDNGLGIKPERQARIFDLFYSTKGGLGFGLWSARRNALINGGDLRVESKAGYGAIFTLILPSANKRMN